MKESRLIKMSIMSACLLSTAALAGSFPGGWCTSGVQKVKGSIPWSGNAKAWYSNAQKAGYPVAAANATGSNDQRGAIIVFDGAPVNGYAGHVAVSLGNGKFIEMNGRGGGAAMGKFTESTWPIAGGARVLGYIYYNLGMVCPPAGSSWASNHPSCP